MLSNVIRCHVNARDTFKMFFSNKKKSQPLVKMLSPLIS